jgi:hypothetical protein
MKQNTRLQLVKPDPPEHEVDAFTERMYAGEIEQFASELDVARSMWRAHRDLVEGPKFPEELRAAFVNASGQQPGEYDVSDDFMQPGFKEKLREETIEYLKTNRRSNAA